MLSPRWRKVLRDLWGSKLRTFLVALHLVMAVLMAAVGGLGLMGTMTLMCSSGRAKSA